MVNILLVEDELIIAEDMTNILEKIGYNVIGVAIDFDEAIEILETEKPDLILLDINLSGKRDGIELAEEINKRFSIPFIFTTSYTDTETLERAKHVNPVNYLVKPFKKEQLYTAIEIAIFNMAKKSDSITKNDENYGEALIIKDALFIKDKFKYTKLIINDILWIKSDGNYLEINTLTKKEIIRATMSGFMDRLNRSNFFRTHKSYIVNLDYLSRFETPYVTIVGTKIPISKTFSDELLKRLKIM
ncbi:DNA-binding LytR/AlgR family response regulator [Flavobacterium arsenatis]|uniref:DNA-binding LytR/AlgR family response regulator n=1 Tax=Flavobacterium arsenatis TaxID=1484332 RepID=A0ABU1TQQ6_9FLAO|nr:response regulator [Flavobacterium arsenatis]MDR6967702.1 DNA-binding LytR/AlgR family response regulator [Flavobacterium arsenatis]